MSSNIDYFLCEKLVRIKKILKQGPLYNRACGKQFKKWVWDFGLLTYELFTPACKLACCVIS